MYKRQAGIAGCPAGGPTCGDTWEHNSDGKVLPSIGFQYDLTDNWSLYGMYSHTYRPPTTHEVFYAGTPFGDGIGNGQSNNLALKGETSDGFDVAISYQNNNVFLDKDSPVSYTHLTLPTILRSCRSRWSPYH